MNRKRIAIILLLSLLLMTTIRAGPFVSAQGDISLSPTSGPVGTVVNISLNDQNYYWDHCFANGVDIGNFHIVSFSYTVTEADGASVSF